MIKGKYTQSCQDDPILITINRRRSMTGRDQCLHVARWIPRGIDMFVVLKDTFQIAMCMKDEEAAKDSSEPEDEAARKERKEALSHV
jgi:hypothetical protein